MADSKASALTAASALTGTELWAGVQTGADAQLTADLVRTFVLASSALTGTPTAPTASPGTNTTQVATTAFVTAGIATSQPLAGNLTTFAGLSLIADRLPYANGTGTMALATFTAAGRALIDDADAAAQRTTLGLAIGSNVQAHSAALDGLAGVTPATNGTYASPTSITIVNGLITAIS